ncbi:MAG TPA: hypothetical protein VKW06_19460 [Candidatus Angelobacter sp.]|nr:hypothetical protein [Candidatus Angelobacter sp.]
MIRISFRIWAGVLALFLLPVFAFASDNNSNSNNSSSAASTSESSSAASATAPSAAPAAGIAVPGDPLLRLMVSQGLLTADDVSKLAGVPSAELRDRLLLILLMKNKNALSADDMSALKAPATTVTAVETTGAAAVGKTSSDEEQATGPPQPPQSPAGGVIPAVAPIRVLQIDPPKREGVAPVINVNKNVRIQPYGFFKASAVYDTSSPYGNDFPLPGFNPVTNGPNALPEFHIKARFARFGGNFEWLDSPEVVVTAKIEGDWEGNFSRVNNRNISTIRSNMFQLRLAFARIDYKPSDTNSFFALFGQDWTPFASSTLPNLFETTGLGVGFGTLYERDPQFRFGMEHNFGSFKLGPEVALVLPAYGNLPADLTAAGAVVPGNEGIGNQLGYGERQGVDSGRPEFQARLVGQWQLDHAAGVAPAQIIVSGVHGSRRVDVLANQVPAAFAAAFPRGTDIWSDRNGWTGEIQLPTHWFTLIGKYYNGSDMRYYFGGQIFSEFNDTTGLTNTATAQSQDGASTLVFGCRGGIGPACTGGTLVVAPQRAPRAQGGFVNLGIPLSRLANANPAGRNAGWVMYLHYGYDQVLARDVRRLGGGREKGDLAAGTLQYKMNNWVTFVLEESLYRTRAIPLTATGLFPAFDGRPMREWKDFRSEIGPLFTF